MENLSNFYKKVKQNRKRLKEKGFTASAICRYEKGQRIPSIEIALKLAQILDMDINNIPYRRIEVNRP